jgi:hypothetical protein
MKTLAKFRGLPPSDRRLLIEASLLLIAARIALRILPFKTIVEWASRRASAVALDDDDARALVRRVRWAVQAGARRGPGRAVCFPQALAAHLLLARRGAPSTIYYGVAKTAAGALEAHVWVRAGALAVVGCAAAARFTLMTTFPRGAALQPQSLP